MKTKKFIVVMMAILLIVTVALTSVACNKKDSPSSEPSADTATKYTVTFDPRNGSTPTTVSVNEGGTVALPESPTLNGADFLGWYTAKTVKGTKWTPETAVTENTYLYGVWKAKDGTETIDLELSYIAGASNDKLFSYSLAVVPGTMAAFPTIERKCFDFAGWYKDADGQNQFDESTIISEPLSLYGLWSLKSGHELTQSSVLNATCTEYGYTNYTCSCGAKHKDNFTLPLGHEFDFSNATYNGEDDYFVMVGCIHDGCDVGLRRESEREFDEAFKYTYSEEIKASIEQHIEDLSGQIDAAPRYDETNPEHKNTDTYDETTQTWTHNNLALYNANKQFEETYYDKFIEDLNYVVEQYQIGYVYYCVYDPNEEWEAKYNDVQKAYNDMISTYYSLFGEVYDTYYREYFFSEEDGWTEEEIEKVLILSAAYGGEEYKSINDSIDEIEVNFRSLSDQIVSDSSGTNGSIVPNMYGEYVNYKNQLAQLSGYENYVEYAYVNEYDRDYSPADVAHLRAYAKEYMVPIFHKINNSYQQSSAYKFNEKQKKYADALLNDSIFKSKLTSDLVGSYLKEMKIEDCDRPMDYYSNLNELFTVGNYFAGNYSGAFNYWIEAQQKSALYFGPGSYSGAFTFIHEFGHYNNSYYNHGTSMSYDLDETHSQGNEMMFLAYLKNVIPEDCKKVYTTVKDDQLYNMLAISLLAMCVDEFEQAVYTNTYTGALYEDGISPSEYDSLFATIMNEYGLTGSLNPAYWRYVVIESACYYISYSTSAMASIQLYAMAMQDLEENGNLDATREKYYKLITFTDDENNAHTDFVGDRVVDIGFADTLKFAGLYSPFEENFYEYLYNYFMN